MTVVYTALFSLVFLLLSVPFSGETWFALGSNSTFLYTVAFMLSAALAVLVSRWLLGRCRNLKRFALLDYVLWVVAEVVLVSLLYTVFTRQGLRLGIISAAPRSNGTIFLSPSSIRPSACAYPMPSAACSPPCATRTTPSA